MSKEKNTPLPSSSFVDKPLPRDLDRAMQETIQAIDHLRDVYTRETAALDAADAGAFLGLQDIKMQVARRYQHCIQDLLSRQHELQKVSPALRKKLAERENAFAELGARNLEALTRMQRTTQRLSRIIMNAAKESARQQRVVAYGQTGAVHGDARKSVSMGVSETA